MKNIFEKGDFRKFSHSNFSKSERLFESAMETVNQYSSEEMYVSFKGI